MESTYQGETIDVQLCSSCGFGAPATDRFCRRCGAVLSEDHEALLKAGACEAEHMVDLVSPFITTPLSESELPRLVSGPLVDAVIASVSSRLSETGYERFQKSVISALLLIPIWLMIILLSPFDAFAAARALRQSSTGFNYSLHHARTALRQAQRSSRL